MKEEVENDKKQRLLNTAFTLFTQKGIKDTSIQEIVDNANVAKGTFYLYFKDKYEIQNILIAKKSEKLFNDALEKLHKNYIESFPDQIIFLKYPYLIDISKENNINLKNPEVTLFMIIELVSSTCFTSILEKEPLPIEEYKPFLYDAIRQFLKA